MFLAAPLLALEIILDQGASWWSLPLQKITSWGIFATLLAAVLAHGILQLRVRAFYGLVFWLSLWELASLYRTFLHQSAALAFFSLLLLAAMMAWVPWLRREMNRSYQRPGTHWYQGLPPTLPGIVCSLACAHFECEATVSQLDADGVFLLLIPKKLQAVLGAKPYSESPTGTGGRRLTAWPDEASQGEAGASAEPSPQPLTNFLELVAALGRRKHPPAQLQFHFAGETLTCQGRLAMVALAGKGAGFRWLNGLSPGAGLSLGDHQKKFGDFFETLVAQGVTFHEH